MDSITHMMVGAVAGEIIAGNKLGKKALLWGAAIANLADIDVIVQPFLSPVKSLFFHRGPTHSIVFCVLFAPLVAKLLTIIHKKTKKQFGVWFKVSIWCLFSHIFIDCFNSYGTAIFYPFSNCRVSFDCIGIVDILFDAPLFIALMYFIFVKQRAQTRKIIAILAMSLSALYLCFTISNKINLERKVEQFLSQHYINYDRILTAPLPLTNFVWLVIVEDEDGFFAGNYTIKSKDVDYKKYFLKNHYLAEEFKNKTEFKELVRFSKGYYCLDRNENGEIVFYDLRIASFDFDGTGDLDKAVFSHTLKISDTGELIIKHTSPKRIVNWENLKKYYNQII